MGILLPLKNRYQRLHNYTPCKNLARDHTKLHDMAAPHPTVHTK